MACCVLIGGMIGLIFSVKARIFGNLADGRGKALEWCLYKENSDDKE
jgi:hypothetical protein